MNTHSHPDGDIILRSLQGTLFPLHSYTLRTTSGLFRTIFTLPQPCSPPPTPIIIPIYEPTSLLTQFLPLLTGRPSPKALHTLDLGTLTRLLVIAEKWDAPGPITYIRNVINGSHFIDQHVFFPYSPFRSVFSPEEDEFDEECTDEYLGPLTGFFRTDPVRVYVLSRHFRWRAEAERAAVSLLALSEEEVERRWVDVREGRLSRFEESAEEEEGEGEDATMFMVTNRAWDSLVELRRRRCGRFKELIDSQERFTAGNNPNNACIRCSTKLDNTSWTELKSAMMAELESRPLGDTVLAAMAVPAGAASTGRRSEGEAWHELVSCFQAQCPVKGCGAANYDPLATIKQIRKCVKELPWRVGWDEDI
ncbi:hypothetical protein M378DRAFT_200831 [Amanita muscaria Koide BX008]|uniref:BTB domain-containing protein n=1 Tax=Amanita muscaria (strain Koide BX008) TaxID=946122 RepID=A0A0C2S3L8_AMAMK|nr:hypothetical protein M378DRAFT_200831 [Amanita muscaria Koide BX008]